MKLRVSIILILLSIFASAPRAQTNCCEIEPGASSTPETPASVPGPQGGTYTKSATQTTAIACQNTNTSPAKPCSASSPPANVVTATGYGAWSTALQKFVACNPSFAPAGPPDQLASGGATWINTGTSYVSLDASGNCVKDPAGPASTTSKCPIVACTPTNTCGTDGGPECPAPRGSPIIIDLIGQGFSLTSAANGVKFDISGTGKPIQMGWTASGADNAFLALPGADGLVHSGKQLFGNYTPQPASPTPNGFAALAVYDNPKNGGNGDGVIDARDAIFSSLRLWIDANHDGISQPEELHTLPSLGVNSISLTYKADQRTDQWGNVFHYHAQVNPGETTSTGRMAYDVFFVAEPDPTAKNIPCPVPTKKAGMLAVAPAALR